MPRPYPRELRQRVVSAWLEGSASQKEVAERFCVGLQTVVRWVGIQRATGSIEPLPMGLPATRSSWTRTVWPADDV